MGMNINAVKGTTGFAPVTYHAAVTVDGAGKTLALNPGTSKVFVYNDQTAAAGIYVTFGATAAEAVTNLGIDTGVATKGIPIQDVSGSTNFQVLTVPVGAKYLAYATDTAATFSGIIVTEGN